MVMVDSKVYQEEVEAFVTAAMKLQKAISPDMMMTRKMAFDWFLDHRERLQTVVDSMEYDKELIEIIAQLRGLPEKVEVLKAMLNIALSDDLYHAKEKMIVKKTILYWNIDPADLKD